MKRTLKALFGLTLLGGWVLALSAIHVVLLPPGELPVVGKLSWVPGIRILTKNTLGFRETFTDARGWTVTDVSRHPLATQRALQLNPGLLAHIGTRDQIQAELDHPTPVAVAAPKSADAVVQAPAPQRPVVPAARPAPAPTPAPEPHIPNIFDDMNNSPNHPK